jgi:hypothetical protein
MRCVAQWVRPYEDPVRALLYVLAMVGTVFAAVVGVLMAVAWQQVSVGEVLIVVSFFAVWLTFAWRFARTALVVSDEGVRLRWLLRTRTLRWDQVREFYTARDGVISQRLWIELSDGTRVRTPVQRARYPTFGPMRRGDSGSLLNPMRYESMLRNLDHWLAAARAAGPHRT